MELHNDDCFNVLPKIQENNRKFIGVEMDKEYFEIAKERILEIDPEDYVGAMHQPV